MSITDDPKRVIGQIICPHQDGDYTVSLIDLHGWSTGSVLLRQEGQHEVHDQVYTREECGQLAALLEKFAKAG